MKNIRKIALCSVIVLLLTGCAIPNMNIRVNTREGNTSDSSIEKYTYSLYENVDYGDDVVYVIGHACPDTDTVTSAISMAYLLNQMGINAKPAIAGPINRESAFVLSKFGFETPEILENAAGKNLWLVDHTAASQAVNGIEEANIVGVIDHHELNSLTTKKAVNVITARSGSTTSLIYREYERCNIDIPKNIAGIMLSGLISDTNNLKSNDVEFDHKVKENLSRIADVDVEELNHNMIRERISYEGMTEEEIYYHDYKEYACNDVVYGVGIINVLEIDEVKPMADRMQEVIDSEIEKSGCDMLVFLVYDMDYAKEYVGYAGSDYDYATKIFKAAFGSNDMCTMEDEMAVFEPSVSRKSVIVPTINEAIRNN